MFILLVYIGVHSHDTLCDRGKRNVLTELLLSELLIQNHLMTKSLEEGVPSDFFNLENNSDPSPIVVTFVHK